MGRATTLLLVLSVAAGGGCSEQSIAPAPLSWDERPALAEVRHPWGHYLQGRRIGLDPGHGGVVGDDGWGFEGPVNLAVARELKRFLERDGATVFMTRTRDVDVPLADRPGLVEEKGAEIFISIHHNALQGSESNYTSTWYHGDPAREPSSLDLARALQRRVVDALRTPRKVPAPVLSDRLMYERGFRVLREATVPAVLCEASFYTHPQERERLLDPDYQRREAYGYYLGLVDYFTGGTPTATLAEVVEETENGRTKRYLEVGLDDGLVGRGGWGSESARILPGSIRCRVGGEAVEHRYDRDRAMLRIPVPARPRSTALELHFENVYKHSNYPTRFWIVSDDDGGLKLASREGSGG